MEETEITLSSVSLEAEGKDEFTAQWEHLLLQEEKLKLSISLPFV